MKKILITGSNGQLGLSLKKVFGRDEELKVRYTDIDTFDITNRAVIDRFIYDNNFDIIINCAAYTSVDKAESENLIAAAINTEAVGRLAQAAARNRVKLLHISTDYVFSGENYRPYDENDEPYPRCIYGRTKLEGEGLLTSFCPDSIIIRTAWLYSEFGKNFVKTMLSKAKDNPAEELKVVCDQLGTPTFAGDLAEAIYKIVKSDKWYPGIYHYTNEGVASWYDFAKMIFRLSGKNMNVTPVKTSQYPTPARRPLYSVLSKNKIKNTYGMTIPYWVDSLQKCLSILNSPE